MREYELGVVLHPDLEIDQDKALAKIDKHISDLKGKIVRRDDWGKRKLAYPIAKQQYGLYYFYHLQLNPASVAELERNLQISNEIMRYLVVKYEAPIETKAEPETEEKDSAKGKSESKGAISK